MQKLISIIHVPTFDSHDKNGFTDIALFRLGRGKIYYLDSAVASLWHFVLNVDAVLLDTG